MASKRHVCERRGWSPVAPSERQEKQLRENARHILRSQLLAEHRNDFGQSLIEFRFFRKREQKRIKAWRKEAAADAMRAIPEPGPQP